MFFRFLILLLSTTLSCVLTLKSQCPAATPLEITAITVAESRCQASGTATIFVTGGTLPYVYEITAGPVLQPSQSNAKFEALSIGTYTVQVKDACNTIVTRNFVITGNYQIPQVTLTQRAPTCPGASDGRITVGVTRGRAPFSYSLIAPSPVTVAAQAGNQFNGLPAGDYTCRITDSCGNFQTRTITVPAADNGDFYIGHAEMRYLSCDSFMVTYWMAPIALLNYKPPYTVTLTTPDGSNATHTLPTFSYFGIYDTFYIKYHHVSGLSHTLLLSATNACGYSTQYGFSTGLMNMYPYAIQPDGCSLSYDYRLDDADNDQSPFILHCNTISYTLKDELGIVLTTQINKSTFSGYPPGKWYTVVREDCCMKDSVDFYWREIPPFKIEGYSLTGGYQNKEGATAANIFCNKRGFIDLIVASGPPSITFSDGTTHNYVYPDTIRNIGQFFFNVILSYLTTGSYKVIALTPCGEKDSIMVNVYPEDLRHSTFNTSLVKGCAGGNKIRLRASNVQNGIYESARYSLNGNISSAISISNGNFTDSLVNLPPGNYYLQYHYMMPYVSHFFSGMNNLPGDNIYDTVIIPPYSQPLFSSTPALATCGNSRSIALLPDTTRGVSPYSYQITGGQVTRPSQASPVFENLSQGTYTVLQADACGNSYSTNITIDTLAVPPVVLGGSSCSGAIAQLSLPNIPYYNYVWRRPNGSTTTGDILSINPFTNADTGWYQIAVTSHMGTCIDTKQRNFHLDFCVVLPMQFLEFKAKAKDNTTVVSWHTAAEESIDYFMLEKSSDGRNFTKWKKEIAAGQLSNKYIARDLQPYKGISYYRLQIIGTDGRESFSNIEKVIHGSKNQIEAIPSVVGSNAAIIINHPEATAGAELNIFSMDGKLVKRIKVSAGSAQTSLLTNDLAAGVYTVAYMTSGSRMNTRIIKW